MSGGLCASLLEGEAGLQAVENMRLGLLGGTFDPVHYGHLILAENAREQCRLAAVWFLPAATAPHKKDRPLTSAEKRIEMLRLAIAGNEAFSICTQEIERGGISYSVETLSFLNAQDPSRELFFLMGTDMLLDLPNWREAERVCQLAVPVVACRGADADLDFSCLEHLVSPERLAYIRRHQVEMPRIGISSAEIRRRVALGQTIRYLVPPAVEMYILSHGLYAAPR